MTNACNEVSSLLELGFRTLDTKKLYDTCRLLSGEFGYMYTLRVGAVPQAFAL